MSFSVRDFLRMMPECKLIAGERGAYYKITSAIVVDTPKGDQWIRGGELILMSGFVFGNDLSRFLDFLVSAREHHAAGMVMKTESEYFTLSEEVIQKADECDLPFIEMPDSYAYADIISPVMEKIAEQAHIREYRNRMVMNLIGNNMGGISDALIQSILGWKCTFGVTAMIIEYEPRSKAADIADFARDNETLLNRVLHAVSRFYTNYSYTVLFGKIVLLIEPTRNVKELQKETIQKCAYGISGVLKEEMGSYVIGYGNNVYNLKEASISYRQAEDAIRIGRKTGVKKHVFDYEALALDRMLLLLGGHSETDEFISLHIGALLIYDKKNNTDYIEILQSIISNGWNLRYTAEELYVHYNTIKNKYYKIQEILGRENISPEDRLNIELAMKLHQLL